MPKHYRVGAFVRFNNAVMKSLLRTDVPVGTFEILTVRGRKSGQPIEIPLVVWPKDGNRYLIAAYGVVNWVLNLRSAGGEATLTRGRRWARLGAIAHHRTESAAAATVLFSTRFDEHDGPWGRVGTDPGPFCAMSAGDVVPVDLDTSEAVR